MIRICLAMLSIAAVAGYAVMVKAVNLPSGDTKNWIAYHIEVGDQIVRFTIPPGINKAFLDPPVPERIDLAQKGVFDEAGRGPKILSRHWDYKNNIGAPVDGTLVVGIWVDYSHNLLTDDNSLKNAVTASKEMARLKASAHDGTAGPPDLPIRFDAVTLSDKRSLFVHYQASMPNYVISFDDHHYLSIFVNPGVSSRAARHQDAKSAADAILNSIRIEPKR